jgi:hypothetical protein
MGALSRGDLKRVLIGSTAERVLEAMPCDVLGLAPMRLPAVDWVNVRIPTLAVRA